MFQHCQRVIALGSLAYVICISSVHAESPSEIYQRRVIPLLRSDTSSSCSECHLGGVNLKEFLYEDQQRTFAELRSRGWIDVEHPERSKLLSLIARSSESPNKFQTETREQELAALSAWISAATTDSGLIAVPIPKRNDLALDNEVMKHARKDQLISRFSQTVWSELERCANCHSPERNEKQREKHGETMSWIVPRSPQATLDLLVERKLIDLDHPHKSLLRTKPLGTDEHGGGIKFPDGGQTDKAWQQFLTDYARTIKGEYRTTQQLPQPIEKRSWRTGLHLRISDWSPELASHLMTVTMHLELPSGEFDNQPIAYAESRVQQASGAWSNSLSAVLTPEAWNRIDPREPPKVEQLLPAGRYELRVWDAIAEEVLSNKSSVRDRSVQQLGRMTIPELWKPGHSSGLKLSQKDLTTPSP